MTGAIECTRHNLNSLISICRSDERATVCQQSILPFPSCKSLPVTTSCLLNSRPIQMLSTKKFVSLASALSSLFVVASAWGIEEGATCEHDTWTGDALIGIRNENCAWRNGIYTLVNSERLLYLQGSEGGGSRDFLIPLPRSRPYEKFYQGEMSNNYAAFDHGCNFSGVVYLHYLQGKLGPEVKDWQVENCERGYNTKEFERLSPWS